MKETLNNELKLNDFKITKPGLGWDVEVSIGKHQFAPRTVFIAFTAAAPENIKERLRSLEAEYGWCVEERTVNNKNPRNKNLGSWMGFYDFTIECIGYHSWDIANDLCKFFENNGMKCHKVQLLTFSDGGTSEEGVYPRYLYRVNYFRPVDSSPEIDYLVSKEFQLI